MDKFVGRDSIPNGIHLKNNDDDYFQELKSRKNSNENTDKYKNQNDNVSKNNEPLNQNNYNRNNLNDKNLRPLSVSSGIELKEKVLEPIQTVENLVQANASNFRLRVAVAVFTILTILLLIGLITFFVLYYGVFFKKPTYKEACSNDKPCIDNKNLICNVTCACSGSMYWDGFHCTPLLSFGSACYGGSFQCLTGLSCINNICQCQNNSYFNGLTCTSKLPYGALCSTCNYSSCPNCISCNQCQDYMNLQCNSTTSRCLCPTVTHYYDSLIQLCVLKQDISIYCTSNTECKDVSQGLYCQTSYPLGSSCPSQPPINFCNCPTNTYFNGSTCKAFELYYATCSQTCNCDTSKGLYCDSSDLRCLCPQNYYWDSTTSNCYQQLSYNAICSSNKQCDSSKGLSCNGGTCNCKLFPGSWYWSSIGQYCIECPFDWTIITFGIIQKCIQVVYTSVVWMQAKSICEQHASHLVTLNDSVYSTNIKATISSSSKIFHIGATDSKVDGTFRWTYDGQLVTYTFLSQCPFLGISENCLAVDFLSNCFHDVHCTSNYLGYICQKNL